MTLTQSDSEDDGDYVPPVHDEQGSESEDETQTKKQRVEPLEDTSQDIEDKQKTRDALWANFQASVAGPSSEKKEEKAEKKMVKVQKRFLFAGDYITEVIEVPEDSPEAEKWPLYKEPASQTDSEALANPPAGHDDLPPIQTASSSTSSSKPPLKRPGPRKPKTVLEAPPSASSQKAKKLTTLDKSLMDWKAHTQDTTLQDELEANRRGGGYLEKVEFLQRVEERKEENLETMKGRKRRKL